MNKTLTHSMKSYITIFLVGILVGCICRLTDYCPADTLWSIFVNSNTIGILDYYQYHHCFSKYFKHLCRD